MDKAREDALWALNLARAHNKAIDKAAWLAWGLRNEGRYVLVLTEKEIKILNEALGGELMGEKLSIRNQLYGALDDEDSTGPIVDAILALSVPFRPTEVEAQFERRNALLDKQHYPNFETLTPEEETEYQSLKEQLARLPTGFDIKDQEARDSIHEAASLLLKHAS